MRPEAGVKSQHTANWMFCALPGTQVDKREGVEKRITKHDTSRRRWWWVQEAGNERMAQQVLRGRWENGSERTKREIER